MQINIYYYCSNLSVVILKAGAKIKHVDGPKTIL